MKKILYVLLATHMCLAHAEWNLVGGFDSSAPFSTYVDLNKIEKNKDASKIWEKNVFRQPQVVEGKNYKVKVAMNEYDCKKREVKITYVALFKNEEMTDVLWQGKINAEAIPILPNSHAEEIEIFACHYKIKK